MKVVSITLAAAIVLSASALCLAQASKSASVPASVPATASNPSTAPSAVAKVGDQAITAQQVDTIFGLIKKADPTAEENASMVRQKITERLVMQQLATTYSKKVEATAAEIQEQKDVVAKQAALMGMTADQFMKDNAVTDEMLLTQARMIKIEKDMTTSEKVAAYVKAHPDYFNGTSIKISHILIAASPSASSAQQKAAQAKLEGIATDIKSGKVKFEDAAKQFSDCPSKEQGGDLGETPFVNPNPRKQLDLAFLKPAFAIKAGELTEIVHTQFGFHLIKVTARTEGKGAPDADAEKIAKAAIDAEIDSGIYSLPLTSLNVEYLVKFDDKPKDAPTTKPGK